MRIGDGSWLVGTWHHPVRKARHRRLEGRVDDDDDDDAQNICETKQEKEEKRKKVSETGDLTGTCWLIPTPIELLERSLNLFSSGRLDTVLDSSYRFVASFCQSADPNPAIGTHS